jgi:riboflavin kinase/FMN adenylyltransferase
VQVIREREPVDLPPGAIVAVGAFDGVHLGHQAVLAEARHRAATRGTTAVVFLREPLPSVGGILTTVEQRLEFLAAFAIDRCIVVAGDDEWPPPQLTSLLTSLPAEGPVQVPPICLPGRREPIASSAIRDALIRGEVELAAAMLGRPYELRGVVEHGDHRGRTIGFPTANLALPSVLQLPADGVYGGWYQGQSGDLHLAAINLGRRPTFYDEGVRLLEAYLLDFDGDLYGDRARVRFGARLRDELKFDSVDELVAQMHADVDAVRRLVSRATIRSADAVERAP